MMFRVTPRIAEHEYVLKLEGCLAGAWVRELDACWREATKSLHGRQMRVDLTDVCHVDNAGRDLMTLMYLAGARFTARGCVMPEVIREIAESVATGWRN